MSKRVGVLCFLLLTVLFLIVNRAAYKGYFQADELDTLGWAQVGSADYYLLNLISPRFSPVNFRPAAHLYFHEAILHFGLDFPRYVLIVHLVHLLNIWLIWLLARHLGCGPRASALACVFFAFHMALFDAVWKPMYIFDVLCASFCLLAILLYAKRWWILSFCAYWLAYKSKELAVMLPVALACYELWFGQRRWKPLVPFFLASFSFGLQGLLLNPNKNNDYTFRFTVEALRTTATFYAGRVLLIPYIGLLVPAAAWFARNRRTWFGLVLMGSFFFPLLFLPGRIASAYCYAPFIGLALVLAAITEVTGVVPVAVALLLWAPLDLHELRMNRNITLARDDETRHWMAGVKRFAETKPQFDAVSWAGRMPGFADWGVSGALEVFFPDEPITIHHFDGPETPELLKTDRVAYLLWNRQQLSTAIREKQEPDSSYLCLDEAAGLWQLDGGWYDVDGDHRWSGPRAEAHLRRPDGRVRFDVRMILPWDRIQKAGPVTLRVKLNGTELEQRVFDSGGDAEAEWDLEPAPAGHTDVTIEADPPFQADPHSGALGVAVRSFGFVKP